MRPLSLPSDCLFHRNLIERFFSINNNNSKDNKRTTTMIKLRFVNAAVIVIVDVVVATNDAYLASSTVICERIT